MSKKINTPTVWGEGFKSFVEWLSDEKRKELLGMLKQKKTEEEEVVLKSLYRDSIIKDLKENHVKIEENVEMMWYKWKEVHIDLPAVWNFKWFKFDYFIADDLVKKVNMDKNTELQKKLYSMKDVSKLLQAMNEYMEELQLENDEDINYEVDLRRREGDCLKKNRAWDCLKAITWLNVWYWLKNKEYWHDDSRVTWVCYGNDCYFGSASYDDFCSNLLLKLSD